MAFGYTRQELIKYAPDRPNYRFYTSSGPQPQRTPYEEQNRRLLGFGLGAGASVGALAIANKIGYNPWDPIYTGLRTIEEFSPGRVFRTLQLGNFASQFTSQGRAALNIPASAIKANSKWFQDLLYRSEYIGNLPAALAATETGLQFRNGTLYAGEHVVLRNARKMISTGNPNLATQYSRAIGFNLPNIHDTMRFGLEGSPGESVYFTGAASRGRAIFNQAHALAGEWTVARANRLAEAPFGIEPFTTGLERVSEAWERTFGTRFTLAVKSGTPMQTFGRMAVKWGGIATAAYLGYQTADWAIRNASIFDGTSLDEGITAGIATVGVKANLLAAKVADTLPGVRSYRDKQEELAPGSTSLMKLAAFPATGALAGGTAYYLSGLYNRVKTTKELMATGLSYTQALPLAEKAWLAKEPSIIQDNPITRALTKRFGEHIPFIGKITRSKAFSFFGAALFTIPILPFIPGALAPSKTEDELQRIYSGQEEVAVRKGRFWELGRSPYEGGKIEYFRPHWYARMMQRSFGKSMHDDDPNPIVQWFKENFTYNVEKEHYKDRPYPITGSAFADIPLVGPLLAATIGRVIKPPKLMHTNEWLGGGTSLSSNSPVLRTPGRLGELPPGDQEQGRGTPIDANNIRTTIGEEAYRIQELSGLTGFLASTFKQMITGEEHVYNQDEVLQSATRMYGAERSFWDLNMGGGAFTNELFRRWYPHRRREIEEYNPIRNTMPSWMPGPGDRSPDFQHGDPFIQVQEGELRLPGKGYAARFPELDGVAPEDYPLIHRYKILSDIAPYSEKTKMYERELMGMAKAGDLSDNDLALFQETRRQNSLKKTNKEFYDFDILEGAPDIDLPESLGANQSRSVVAALNKILAAKRDQKLTASREIIGGYWQGLANVLQSPLESLTPVAPGSKLLNMKSALQDYKQTQVYGPDIAFWQHPIENFIKPFIRETADLVGLQGVPEGVQHVRAIDEYFDVLKYVKNKRLAEISREEGVGSVAGAYERKAGETVTGVNPYTRDYSSLFRSLPRSERDYFGEFVGAKTEEERAEILKLVPPNLRRIYIAQWEQQYASVIQQALQKNLLSGSTAEEAQVDLQAFYQKRQSEGFPVTEEYLAQYKDQKQYDETYGDWFRRAVMIPGVVGEEGLPGPDWVGWSPQVDLDEVKLKVVQNEGMDIHDFNLWQSDEKSAAGKPYLDDVASQLVSTVLEHETRSPQQVQEEVRKILSELGIGSNARVFVYQIADDRGGVEIDVDTSEIRDKDLKKAVAERLSELG